MEMEKTQGKKPKSNRYDGRANLVSLADRTTEEKRRIAKLGGKASQEAQRKRKTAREILDRMLSHEMTGEQATEILGESALDILEGDLTAYAVLLARMYQKAAQGDAYAFQLLRDTAGDKPVDKIESKQEVTAADLAMVEKVKNRLKIDVS